MDYSNHHSRGRYKSGFTRLQRFYLVLGIVALVGAGIFAVYEYQTHPQWAETVAGYHNSVNTWLTERKQNMHHGVAAKGRKDVADREDSDQAVNFEFYSTLQDMKSMEVEAQAAAQKKLVDQSDAEAKTKIAVEKNASLKTVAVKKQDHAVPTAKKIKPVKISHAADLEKDLLATMKQKSGE